MEPELNGDNNGPDSEERSVPRLVGQVGVLSSSSENQPVPAASPPKNPYKIQMDLQMRENQASDLSAKGGLAINLINVEVCRIGSNSPVAVILLKDGDKLTKEPIIDKEKGLLPGIFKVEKILDKRFRFDEEQYLIKWVGYSKNDNTWESPDHIIDKDLITKFENGRMLKRQDFFDEQKRKQKELKNEQKQKRYEKEKQRPENERKRKRQEVHKPPKANKKLRLEVTQRKQRKSLRKKPFKKEKEIPKRVLRSSRRMSPSLNVSRTNSSISSRENSVATSESDDQDFLNGQTDQGDFQFPAGNQGVVSIQLIWSAVEGTQSTVIEASGHQQESIREGNQSTTAGVSVQQQDSTGTGNQSAVSGVSGQPQRPADDGHTSAVALIPNHPQYHAPMNDPIRVTMSFQSIAAMFGSVSRYNQPPVNPIGVNAVPVEFKNVYNEQQQQHHFNNIFPYIDISGSSTAIFYLNPCHILARQPAGEHGPPMFLVHWGNYAYRVTWIEESFIKTHFPNMVIQFYETICN